MRDFPLLEAVDIECRVKQVVTKKDGTVVGVMLLLYKTARTDAKLLDDKFGILGWQNKYESIDGKLFCGIGIQNANGDWVWKYDTGVESNTEAQKGEASDAFKRAGFKWGIGAELYTAPKIIVNAQNCNIVNGKCYDSFYVSKINYTSDGMIAELEISVKDKTVFRWSIA